VGSTTEGRNQGPERRPSSSLKPSGAKTALLKSNVAENKNQLTDEVNATIVICHGNSESFSYTTTTVLATGR
jgi:hypothetical protein